MASIEYLTWDSDFFEKKIGKYELRTAEDVLASATLIAEAKKQDYELVYLFAPENQKFPEAAYNQFDTRLIDTRLVFTRSIDDSVAYTHPNMHTYQTSDNLNQLYALAQEGGKHSRYKLDTRFTEQDYTRLYHTWMANSLNGTLADNVFVYKEADEIVGMITLRISGEAGIPGIMATNPAHRGKGIGTAYFKYMLAHLLEKQVPRVDFITQKSNTTACRIYHKTGCQLVSATDIYHVWL